MKQVKDIMVRLDNAFMLPIDAVLDFDTMAEVEYHGQFYLTYRNEFEIRVKLKQMCVRLLKDSSLRKRTN